MSHTVSYQDVPPEILAGIFELGALAWGVGCLPSLCLVCRDWNDIVANTPRLWGIIDINHRSPDRFLNSQIDKAKASPLSVFVNLVIETKGHNSLRNKKSGKSQILKRLTDLTQNWVRASITTYVLSTCRWVDLRTNLEELHLSKSSLSCNIDHFFQDSNTAPSLPPKLHTITADAIPKSWTLPFLTSNIKSFSLYRTNDFDVTGYLPRIPHVIHLRLNKIQTPVIFALAGAQQAVLLENLAVLELSHVEHPFFILSHIRATKLEKLSIEHTPRSRHLSQTSQVSLSPFFAQWSQPTFLPSSLHTLKLAECLRPGDVEFLLRWL